MNRLTNGITRRGFVAASLIGLAGMLAGCSRGGADSVEAGLDESAGTSVSQAPAPASSTAAAATKGSTLIAYFTWSPSAVTEQVARYIQGKTGGEMLEIEPAVPYPDVYQECGDVAKAERDENQRPAIANLPASLDGYDSIIVGFPIWWHTAPMIIGTFLESYDLSGKQVYVFTQCDSMSQEYFENAMDFVREEAQGAEVHEGLYARPGQTELIDEWVSREELA